MITLLAVDFSQLFVHLPIGFSGCYSTVKHADDFSFVPGRQGKFCIFLVNTLRRRICFDNGTISGKSACVVFSLVKIVGKNFLCLDISGLESRVFLKIGQHLFLCACLAGDLIKLLHYLSILGSLYRQFLVELKSLLVVFCLAAGFGVHLQM